VDSLTEREQMLVSVAWWLGAHERPADPRTPDQGASAARPCVTVATPHRDLPELLTVAELRIVTNLSRSAAYDLARRHGIKVGGRRLVPKSVLKPPRDVLI